MDIHYRKFAQLVVVLASISLVCVATGFNIQELFILHVGASGSSHGWVLCLYSAV